jgi:phosphatidylglycerol:prolipoprotein diacylglycerol transferase
LLILTNKVKKDGTLLALYSICYGIARFVIEGLRTDSLYLVGNIRISQVVSIAFIIGGIILLLLLQKGMFQGQKYEGKYLISSDEKTNIK